MKGLGGILAVLGVIILIVGVVNHFATIFAKGSSHASLIVAIVGVVLAVIGIVMFMMPRKAAA